MSLILTGISNFFELFLYTLSIINSCAIEKFETKNIIKNGRIVLKFLFIVDDYVLQNTKIEVQKK
jgi:hypothetical protein